MRKLRQIGALDIAGALVIAGLAAWLIFAVVSAYSASMALMQLKGITP